MNAVPAAERGTASGVRATFQNTGTVLSIGVFFSLLVLGLSRSLPGVLRHDLAAQGVPAPAAAAIAAVPPVRLLFAAFLGVDPIASLTGRTSFPELLSGPFHDGLTIVFLVAAALCALAAVVSLLRGKPDVHDEHAHDHDLRVESDCG